MDKLAYPERVRLIKDEVFGEGREFYQAGYKVFIKFIEESHLQPHQQYYIKTKAAQWYKFLFDQEASVFGIHRSDMDFDYCVNYRESQNMRIGQALVACLNGSYCLNPEFQILENVLAILSFRTQIIDDIADLKEDLVMERPSYTVGALTNNPRELENVTRNILFNQRITKVSPKLLQVEAPQAFELIRTQYDEYGALIRSYGPHYQMLARMGDWLFNIFPYFRTIMYHVDPNYANF